MLAGQAPDLAGQVRIAGQMQVPELLVAQGSDAVEAVAVLVIEPRTQPGLAGGGSQEQGFGGGGMAAQVDQGGPNNVLAELAGGNSHIALATGSRWGRGAGSVLVVVKRPHRKRG